MPGENSNRHNANVQHDGNEGIRRRALTWDDVRKYALGSIGFPISDVELSTQQESILFERVLDEYNRWMPVYKMDTITSVSGRVNNYDLLALGKPYGRGIVDVQIVSQQKYFAPISGVFNLGVPLPISHLSPDQYQLALQYVAMAKKIYSSEMDWQWEEPVLWLYAPNSFGGPFAASYTFTQDCSSPGDIPAEDWGWTKDYYASLVKIAVGETRAKFGGIPGPAAQTMRGENLIRDGKEERDKLEESIRQRSYARTPPLWCTSKD